MGNNCWRVWGLKIDGARDFLTGTNFQSCIGCPREKCFFIILLLIFFFYCHWADSTARALCWQGLEVSKGLFHPSPNTFPPHQGDVVSWPGSESPDSSKFYPKSCLRCFPVDCFAREAMPRSGGRAGWAWVVPRVLSLGASSQEQDFWETSLCFHAGSVLARGCWHFDVSWRCSGEVALEKWQHKTLINVSKESQPERFPLSCLHFHM